MIPLTEVLKKVCSTCGVEKSIDEFHRNKNYAGGRVGQCKPCRMQRVKAWKIANPEKVLAIRKRYQATDKCKEMWKRSRLKQPAERRKANLERWKVAHPEKAAEYGLNRTLKRRGMSHAEFKKFSSKHGNVCGICGQPDEAGRRLAVDHCHTKNENRGLLCLKHNTMLGLAEDSVEILRKAIAYLERHNGGNG